MKKPKKRQPIVGDLVKLRGRSPSGVLEVVNSINWCRVKWTSEESGPQIVHLFELETVEAKD